METEVRNGWYEDPSSPWNYVVERNDATGAVRHRPRRLKGSTDDDAFRLSMEDLTSWRNGPPPKK